MWDDIWGWVVHEADDFATGWLILYFCAVGQGGLCR
jgi:hypothetical protein